MQDPRLRDVGVDAREARCGRRRGPPAARRRRFRRQARSVRGDVALAGRVGMQTERARMRLALGQPGVSLLLPPQAVRSSCPASSAAASFSAALRSLSGALEPLARLVDLHHNVAIRRILVGARRRRRPGGKVDRSELECPSPKQRMPHRSVRARRTRPGGGRGREHYSPVCSGRVKPTSPERGGAPTIRRSAFPPTMLRPSLRPAAATPALSNRAFRHSLTRCRLGRCGCSRSSTTAIASSAVGFSPGEATAGPIGSSKRPCNAALRSRRYD